MKNARVRSLLRSGSRSFWVRWVASMVLVAGLSTVVTYEVVGLQARRAGVGGPQAVAVQRSQVDGGQSESAGVEGAAARHEDHKANASRDHSRRLRVWPSIERALDSGGKPADMLTTTTRDDALAAPGSEASSGSGPKRNAAGSVLEMAGSRTFVSIGQYLDGVPNRTVAHWCRELAAHVDGVGRSECMSRHFRDTGYRSVDRRALVIKRINATTQPAAGRVLLISATHGDEPSSIAAVLRWMHLIELGGTRYDWHIVPMLNPDGVLREPATRVNARGIDLNRNLPTRGWARKSRAYWQRVGFEIRRYPGKHAGSEPENQWLMHEIAVFQPDVIITLHAPYDLVDYDGDAPAPQQLGSLHLHRLGVYPGSLGNFAWRMRGIPVVTIELGDARQPPGPDTSRQMWQDINNWLGHYLNHARSARSERDSNDTG